VGCAVAGIFLARFKNGGRMTASWQQVPDTVVSLLPDAVRAKVAYIGHKDPALISPREYATWYPDSNAIFIYSHAMVPMSKAAAYEFVYVAPNDRPDWDKEILIKRAAIPYVSGAVDFAHTALGGPRPLSNAIVASLLGGGLGYGAGTLVEQLFPKRYLERGKLRRTLGLTGALGGVALGVNNSYANAKALDRSFWRGMLTRNDTEVPLPSPIKKAFQSNAFGQPLYQPTISVPQFNNAMWRDVNQGVALNQPFRTQPAHAAAATGLMAGLSAGQRSPIIRPVDVIRGIASAGVGLATATVAGKALSALAGLTPSGQQKLQDMGMWGGMMHAIVPSVFGMR
jgi:hypothetical protein